MEEEKKDEQTLEWLLPDHVYDGLKWLGLIALPAIAWFVGTVGGEIGLDDPASAHRHPHRSKRLEGRRFR